MRRVTFNSMSKPRRPERVVQSATPSSTKNGELIHLLSTEGLSRDILTHILDTANFVSVNSREKKVPLLRGKSVFNLFLKTARARAPLSISPPSASRPMCSRSTLGSSTAKGETLLDTIDNLSAMAADILWCATANRVRHYLIAQHVAPHVHVVNAGDGRHAHPTQGLLDMYTIRHTKDFANLRVAIVGDVLHSRVARSDIHALTTLGCAEARGGPAHLVPGDPRMGVRVFHTLEEGIKDCDVIIMLRLQNERMSGALLPSSQEYFKHFGLTQEKLRLAQCPMPSSCTLAPSTGAWRSTCRCGRWPAGGDPLAGHFGIAVRMAVMSIVAAMKPEAVPWSLLF